MFPIRVPVKKLRCLEGKAKHARPDATFRRGPDASCYDPKSLACPRRGGTNTQPDVDVHITDLTRESPKPRS